MVNHYLYYGTYSHSFLIIFSNDEIIMEIMMLYDALWDDNYNHSSFPYSFEDNISDIYSPNFIEIYMNYVYIYAIDSEKNFSNIAENLPLDIFIKPRIF